MRVLETCPWLSALTAALALASMAMRCTTLLIGLLVTLKRAHASDRPEIFREFAHAAGGRLLHPRSAVSVGSKSKSSTGDSSAR